MAGNYEEHQGRRHCGFGNLSARHTDVHGDGSERAIFLRGQGKSRPRKSEGARVGRINVEISAGPSERKAGRKMDVDGKNFQAGKVITSSWELSRPSSELQKVRSRSPASDLSLGRLCRLFPSAASRVFPDAARS